MKTAFFISSHGFGHTARESAIMAQLSALSPEIEFTIYSNTPVSFFTQSGIKDFTFHAVQTDVGLAQDSPFKINFPKSLANLDKFVGALDDSSEYFAAELTANGIELVVSDISPLGVLAAHRAGVKSLLIENFTWDWIYQPYLADYPQFERFIQKYRNIYGLVDGHIQLEPVCQPSPNADLTLPLISRRPQKQADFMRESLGIRNGEKLGIVSMGGIPYNYTKSLNLERKPDHLKLILLGNYPDISEKDGIIRIPHESRYYHPDLINAADFVIGKAGYSLIAEVITLGKPFGYISRGDFRESPCLDFYLKNIPNTMSVNPESEDLIEVARRLSAMESVETKEMNGARLAAEFILEKFSPGKMQFDRSQQA